MVSLGDYLMNILRRIQYSRIGRVIFKKGPLLEAARASRRVVMAVVDEIQERRNKNEKLMEVMRTNFEGYTFQMPETDEVIDIIVPIYNGYEYLVKLFEDLRKTNMKTRIILVDDKSPDERVHKLEREYAAKYDNVVLIESEENYGFVMSVNRGLEIAQGHVALVNTDTELPSGWLERLMYPILFEKKVATTTPYTNSGTIFSFPNMNANNVIYRGLDVETIDSYFRQVKPRYASAPTGVGFCMGMNKAAIKEIGFLDYEAYDRGYAEENDWCQKAIKKGYRNVQVENLFVYHKHGGSFLSDEKKKLIETHLETLKSRFPNYDGQVTSFVISDPNKSVRNLMQMIIDMHERKSILCFDHSLSGGASSYLEKKKRQCFQQDMCTTTIRYEYVKRKFYMDFENGDVKLFYEFKNFEDLLEAGKWLHFDEIWINELVTYPKLWDCMNTITQIKEQQQGKLIMLMHDYFSICPTVNLMTEDYHYCDMPGGEKCQACYSSKNYKDEYACASQAEWVEKWKEFLQKCDEVRSFSEDTLARAKKCFGEELPHTLVPHEVNYMVPIHKEHTLSDTITIGLLGTLIHHKGSDLVEAMLQEIEEKNLNVRIVLIGKVMGTSIGNHKNFKETGEYHMGDIPRLVYENDIDIFMMASIWPETFSYTTSEVMQMGLPVASFDLGAPAERIKKYEKGLILSERNAAVVLDEIVDFVQNKLDVKKHILPKKKVIYIAEYISFSSRYRLEHMYEELLYMGVTGEMWETANLPKNRDWSDVDAVVVYRCRDMEPLTSLIEEIKSHNIPIIYDTDDYIFEYEDIKDLPFMKDEEYKDFDVYSKGMYDCMAKCDAFTVSTNNMKLAVEKSFPGKKVFVNRNVASAKMLICSLLAYETRKIHKDKVILGYFSGSNTHSRDFELIADTLASVMKQRENVYLKIVGCLELPECFDGVEDRIIREGFMDWTELPASIAECDINLMPLEDTFFHRCKSENKWMEAALVKVPTIGSFNDELDGATSNGENVFLCKDAKEWEEKLLCLIDDADLRNDMAEKAFQYVMENKNTLVENKDLLSFVIS